MNSISPDSIICITGHRPEKLDDIEWVESALKKVMQELHPAHLIQGMAAGVDILSAEVAHELGVTYTAAKPWAGHNARGADRERYAKIIADAEHVVDVNPSREYIGPHLYQKRNEWMVDHATVIVAVWDGTSGGTKNCVLYAKKKELPMIRINPKTKEISYPDLDTSGEEPEQLTLF